MSAINSLRSLRSGKRKNGDHEPESMEQQVESKRLKTVASKETSTAGQALSTPNIPHQNENISENRLQHAARAQSSAPPQNNEREGSDRNLSDEVEAQKLQRADQRQEVSLPSGSARLPLAVEGPDDPARRVPSPSGLQSDPFTAHMPRMGNRVSFALDPVKEALARLSTDLHVHSDYDYDQNQKILEMLLQLVTTQSRRHDEILAGLAKTLPEEEVIALLRRADTTTAELVHAQEVIATQQRHQDEMAAELAQAREEAAAQHRHRDEATAALAKAQDVIATLARQQEKTSVELAQATDQIQLINTDLQMLLLEQKQVLEEMEQANKVVQKGAKEILRLMQGYCSTRLP